MEDEIKIPIYYTEVNGKRLIDWELMKEEFLGKLNYLVEMQNKKEKHSKYWKVTIINDEIKEIHNRVEDLNDFFKDFSNPENFTYEIEKLSKEEYEETEK